MSNISYSKWLNVPLHLRAKIAQEFGIEKVRPTHVSDNKVVDDGYNLHDVENALSNDRLNALFMADVQDTNILLDMLVEWAEGKREFGKYEPSILELPPEEAKQFKAEYEERTGKEAPKLEEEITIKQTKNGKTKKGK